MLRKELTILIALVLLTSALPARVQAQPDAPAALRDLGSVEQFRDAFNAEKDRPRLVLLLSPT
jgi:hypothetical protein